MSYRSERDYLLQDTNYTASTGLDFSGYSIEELAKKWRELLESGTHGLCFSLYEDGQKPGDIISVGQVQRRMEIIKPYTKWVRSFSCIEGNEHIPRVARQMGMKTLVGAWLGDDPELNKKEIESLIQLANEGFVDIAAVGNEVMYRGDLSEDELLDFIYQVKEAIPDIPVGYVDAYYEFSHRHRITQACDVILANCYPYWEGCPLEYSLQHMKNMYFGAMAAGQGKKVIITETGWPSQGGGLKASIASPENAIKYFINTQLWSKADDIEIFYFSSFDESWKVGAEGDVGAYWGLWDKHENLKF
jgi:exo-beta-1,3-glucanase (GH17 family)